MLQHSLLPVIFEHLINYFMIKSELTLEQKLQGVIFIAICFAAVVDYLVR